MYSNQGWISWDTNEVVASGSFFTCAVRAPLSRLSNLLLPLFKPHLISSESSHMFVKNEAKPICANVSKEGPFKNLMCRQKES